MVIVTQSYLKLVKRYIIERVHSDLCYENNYLKILQNIREKNDKKIWDDIFDTYDYEIEYFLFLLNYGKSEYIDQILPITDRIVIYKNISFQEKIELYANLEENFEVFKQKMTTPEYKTQILNKYIKEETIQNIKNTIIFGVFIQIIEDHKVSWFVPTYTPKEDYINFLSLIEYVSDNNIDLENTIKHIPSLDYISFTNKNINEPEEFCKRLERKIILDIKEWW